MAEINLVSSKLAPSASEKKIVEYLKKISVILTPVVVISIAGMILISIVNSVRMKSLERQKDELTAKIKSMESVEQQYVFVLDRLKKIKEIKNQPDAYDDFRILRDLITDLPEGASFIESSVSSGKLSVSYSADSSKLLSQIFSEVLANDEYQKVSLKDFNFTSERGYLFSFDLSKS